MTTTLNTTHNDLLTTLQSAVEIFHTTLAAAQGPAPATKDADARDEVLDALVAMHRVAGDNMPKEQVNSTEDTKRDITQAWRAFNQTKRMLESRAAYMEKHHPHHFSFCEAIVRKQARHWDSISDKRAALRKNNI